MERFLELNPTISEWLQKHSEDKQTQYFHDLISLGNILEKQLVPLGVLRRDWQQNAQDLFGTNDKNDNILTTASKMLKS